MSKQEPTEQVKFLVACIGSTSNGRPDFQQVATELGIVSKAAAQKRYERMLKAHGINSKGGAVNNGATDDKSIPSTPTKRKARSAPAGSAKKKGRAAAKKESDDEDEKPVKAKGGKLKKEDDDSSSSSLTDAPSSDEDVKMEA